MHLVTNSEIQKYLAYDYLIDFLENSHRGPVPAGNCMVMDEPMSGSGKVRSGNNQFVSLLGWQADDVIVSKLVGVFPGNLSLDPPQASVQGLVSVFDGKTGRPLLVADGQEMTFRKTAADSGLGSKLLARKDAAILLVVGAGGLAPHVIEAHLKARPSITKILIWNRTHHRAEELAARLSCEGVEIQAVAKLDDAVVQADIISCVTMSKAPLVKGDLLKPGAHLDLVGAYLPTMREADDKAMQRGSIFVDTRNGMEGAGDLAQPVNAGLLKWADVKADFYDLVNGRHQGRISAEEITVFKNVGGGHLDLMAAKALLGQVKGQ